METAVLLPNVDYSRSISLNTDGLCMVLSTFSSVILNLQSQFSHFSSAIQQYFPISLTDKESDYDDELIRIRSRLLKCEHDSEKAKEVPDLQFEVKEMQFALSKLESQMSQHTQQLKGFHESYMGLVGRDDEVKDWVTATISAAEEEFARRVIYPFQTELDQSVQAKLVRIQEDLKQGLSSLKSRSTDLDSDTSPQVISTKLLNLNIRVKRLEDSVMNTECSMKPEYDGEAIEKLRKEVEGMSEMVKTLWSKNGEEEKTMKKMGKMTFGAVNQSLYIQKTEEINRELENKASIHQLLELETQYFPLSTMEKIEGIIKLLTSRNHIKNDILVQKVQELEDKLNKTTGNVTADEALLVKKQLLQCASCSQELKQLPGHVGFTPWKKMPLAEGVGRRASSQSFTRTRSSIGKS